MKRPSPRRPGKSIVNQKQTPWGLIVTVAVIVLLAAGVITYAVVSHSGNGGHPPTAGGSDIAGTTLTGPAGPEGIALEQAPVLAPATTAATGQTVDGVQCNSMEQAVYHIHTHLTIYVNGALRAVPPGVGVVQPVPQHTRNGVFESASRCYYWLHTHAQDGIIHVEAPSHTSYTLGQFFAIWRQPLNTHNVGPASGAVTVFVNGHRHTGDPAAIPLQSHEDVQIDVGTPVIAAKKVDWSHAQL
ncbi:MAG: hypothetical protein J2P17_19515 [Mycobacterium sp.]|nr:hypothetical protein [Mycobacterium sp.]